MKTLTKKLIALCLVLCLTLSGCSSIDVMGYFDNLVSIFTGVTAFDRMTYTRPNMDAFDNALEEVSTLAAGSDLEALLDGIWAFYDVYDAFNTAYALATIHYYQDLTDAYWTEEYNFCLEHISDADAGLDKLYRTLAGSPMRDQLEADEYFGAGYFDYYDSEGIYDETMMELLEEESAILSRYYALSAEAAGTAYYSEEFFSTYGNPMAEIYLELIALRQQIAAHLGYEDYVQFAYDTYYYRDYTPQQATAYLADIRAELVPLYTRHLESDFWDQDLASAGERDTFGYVSSMAQNMGGLIREAFQTLEKGKLYDISYGENKYNASFEIYLPSYYEPFVFVNPTLTVFDHLAFAHEFGHFCCDYASYGSSAGIDVSEIFSQSMEYLSLCYADGGDKLTQLKLSDGLCLYVEQAALASFEQQVYQLEGSELTVENVQALYTQVCQAYGMVSEEWDSRSYVTITHFFTNPMYIMSYVVSNDAALQIYQLELEQSGAGVACLESNLATPHFQLLAFLKEAGLTSPFADGRLPQVKALFEEKLLIN